MTGPPEEQLLDQELAAAQRRVLLASRMAPEAFTAQVHRLAELVHQVEQICAPRTAAEGAP